ncbi:sugar phosphate isomerase/epimerase [Microbacterium sp. 18062]|uniref:sugar phosphate isomerase/epimerase family protein n=1 Tax=Microbacterium sp. 18062 TaxID=2681410 RepID=UPI00135A919D|nr:sugar phosphate isomerase/epimerase family protein [Microbacterium sp. 18062]
MNPDLDLDLDLACHLNVLVPDAEPVRLDGALATLADLGYRRVVLPPLDPGETDPAPLRAALARHGLAPITIAGQTPDADVSSDEPEVAAAGERALRAVLELTVALGGDQMNGVPYGVFAHPTAPVPTGRFDRAARAVGRVADEAHERGVTVTFEVLNRYETSVVNTAERAMELVDRSGSDHLRIHLDTFHMAVEEADLNAAIRTALPKLGYLELGQSGRGHLGSGAIDLPAVIARAIDDGYEGRWGVEAFSRAVLAEPVADTLAIWRSPFQDGGEIAEEALRVIRRGWSESTAGRRAHRLARGATT